MFHIKIRAVCTAKKVKTFGDDQLLMKSLTPVMIRPLITLYKIEDSQRWCGVFRKTEK